MSIDVTTRKFNKRRVVSEQSNMAQHTRIESLTEPKTMNTKEKSQLLDTYTHFTCSSTPNPYSRQRNRSLSLRAISILSLLLVYLSTGSLHSSVHGAATVKVISVTSPSDEHRNSTMPSPSSGSIQKQKGVSTPTPYNVPTKLEGAYSVSLSGGSSNNSVGNENNATSEGSAVGSWAFTKKVIGSFSPWTVAAISLAAIMTVILTIVIANGLFWFCRYIFRHLLRRFRELRQKWRQRRDPLQDALSSIVIPPVSVLQPKSAHLEEKPRYEKGKVHDNPTNEKSKTKKAMPSQVAHGKEGEHSDGREKLIPLSRKDLDDSHGESTPISPMRQRKSQRKGEKLVTKMERGEAEEDENQDRMHQAPSSPSVLKRRDSL